MQRSLGQRVFIVLSVLSLVVVLTVVGAVFVLARFEKVGKEWAGECGRESRVSPRPAIKESAVDDYERANVALLDGFVESFGPPRSVEHRYAYKCPDNADRGAVVGVTSMAIFAAPEIGERCAVVERIDALLVARGWTTSTLETTNPQGPGMVGATDAWRDRARLSASVQMAERTILVTVDHDVDASPGDRLSVNASECFR